MIDSKTLEDLFYGSNVNAETLQPLLDSYMLCTLKIQQLRAKTHYQQEAIWLLEDERLQIERNVYHIINAAPITN